MILIRRGTPLSQPQGAALAEPWVRIAQAANLPAGAAWRELAPGTPAWTVNNAAALSASVCAVGPSVLNVGTGYFSRPAQSTTGPLTLALVFTPTSITGTEGIWSQGDVYNSSYPLVLILRNGADVRLWVAGSYIGTLAGIAIVGKPLHIVLSMSNLVETAGGTARLDVNGRAVSGTISAGTVNGRTVEFLGSGYVGQADGHYSLYWRAAVYLPAGQAARLAANPWQLFQPGARKLWVPLAAAGGAATVNGTSSATLGRIEPATSGTVEARGAAAVAVAPLAQAAHAALPVVGAASITLGGVSLADAGAVRASGSASASLGTIAGSAAGTAAAPGAVVGHFNRQLADVVGQGGGTVRAAGHGNQTLSPVTLARLAPSAPAARTLAIEAETRALQIAAEPRQLSVGAESRTLLVAA